VERLARASALEWAGTWQTAQSVLKWSRMKTPNLVLIEWEDSHYKPGWTREIGEGQLTPVLCKSVGWLLHDGDEAKVLANHLSDEDEPQSCGAMTIPSRAIVKIRRLR